MIDMYKIIEGLCRRNGISIAVLCRGSGVPPSTITELKHGRTKNLSHNNMLKISEYFDISTDVFSEGTYNETVMGAVDFDCYFGNEKKAPTERQEPSKEDMKIALFGGDGDVTDEMWEEALFAAQLIKDRHKRKRNDK